MQRPFRMLLDAPRPSEISSPSLHDALPIFTTAKRDLRAGETLDGEGGYTVFGKLRPADYSLEKSALPLGLPHGDRKSTRLNSSHVAISYAVYCLKKKTSQGRKERKRPSKLT